MEHREVVEAAEVGFRSTVAVGLFTEGSRRTERSVPCRLTHNSSRAGHERHPRSRKHRLSVVLLELIKARLPVQRAIAGRDKVHFIANEAVEFLVIERFHGVDSQ